MVYNVTMRTNPPIKAATAAQPARNPITEVRDGIGISSPNAERSIGRSGGVTPSGNVQGSTIFSPAWMGVRIRA